MKISIKEVGLLAREIDADAFRMPLNRKHSRYREDLERRERALRAASKIVEAYDKANPMRTADYHGTDCDCLRCAVDALRES